jgi:hypothetical protein
MDGQVFTVTRSGVTNLRISNKKGTDEVVPQSIPDDTNLSLI